MMATPLGDGTRNSVAVVTAAVHKDISTAIALLDGLSPPEMTALAVALTFTLSELVGMAETKTPGFADLYLDAIGKRAAAIQ